MKGPSTESGGGQNRVPLLPKGKIPSDTMKMVEPLASHRLSMASTGVGEGTPLTYRSPQWTYRSYAPAKEETTAGMQYPAGLWASEATLPPGETSPLLPLQKSPIDPVKIAHAVTGEPPVLPTNYLRSPALIAAKKYGTALPPLREYCEDIIHETTIDPDSRAAVNALSKRLMLEMAGESVHSKDPMFTEDIVQYQLEHPIPPHALRKFPGYSDFPLLLSKIARPQLESNTTDVQAVHRLRGHNEAMMDNIWNSYRDGLPAGGPREAYMYVPNFGRVQVLLLYCPDGTSYPLVTLPKMTPHDILAVIDKQKAHRERQWMYRCRRFLRQVTCGVF